MIKILRSLSPFARSILRLLVVIAATLIVVDIVIYTLLTTTETQGFSDGLRTIKPYFDSDAERTIPAWFNGSLWFLSSAIALLIAAGRRSKAWVGFAVICAGLSMDEIIGFHEGLGSQAQRIVGNQTGLLNFEWVILGAMLAAVLAIAGYQAVKTLTRQQQQLIFAAGIIFVTGALVFESLSGLAIENNGAALLYHSMAWIEESLEMIGVSLLIATLVSASGIAPKRTTNE